MKLLAISVGALILHSCISTKPSPDTAKREYLPESQIYANYLQASYANKIGDIKASADFYAKAFALRADDVDFGKNALVAVHMAGDTKFAYKLAEQVLKLDEDVAFAKTVIATRLMKNDKYEEVIEVLRPAKYGAVGMEDFNTLIRGWAEAGNGSDEVAIETFGFLLGGRYFELLGMLQQAKLYQQNGEIAKAEKLYSEIHKTDLAPIEATLSQARGYMQNDQKQKAINVLQNYIDEAGGSMSNPIRKMLANIKSGNKHNWKLTPQQQASRALSEPAFRFYAGQKQLEAADIYLRIALEIDDKNDKAKLFLGTVLEQMDRKEEALSIFSEIPFSSDFSVSARLSEADILFDQKKNKQAIKTLKSIEKTDIPSEIVQSSLGRGYLIIEDYAKALPYYNAIIKSKSLDERKKNPMAHYLRGICLERLGRWEEAVKDFEFVLKHQPDNADALNYLGYTWVDKGVHLNKAFKMIERAVKLEPESGAIIDSLGWAHYKLGQLSQAKKYLEEAAQKSPTSATIIDHLGDVYWRLGRFKEARYQWERALGLDPSEKEIKSINEKLKTGLKLPSDKTEK